MRMGRDLLMNMSPTCVCVKRVGNIRLSMQVKKTALGCHKNVDVALISDY